MNLSDRQQNMIQFIAEFVDENNFPPTIREIGEACDISSTSVVKYNLNKLEKYGLITRQAEVSRGLSLNWEKLSEMNMAADLDGAEMHLPSNGYPVEAGALRIPVLGPIAAGKPIQVNPANTQTADEFVELSSLLTRDQEGIYALRVQGNSMVDASVLDGDIVILRHQEKAENGQMVAAWIEGEEETTLKRFYQKGKFVELRPCNPNYDVMTFPAEKVRIMGKVISVIREL